MRRLAAVLVVAAFAGGGPAACGGENWARKCTTTGKVVECAPAQRPQVTDVTGELLDGGTYDVTADRGKVVVVNFWGSWCAPCRVETPEFQQVYTEVAGDGVQFLGLNVKDQEQFAQAFVTSKGITFPSLFDPKGEVALAFRDYPASAIPSTIVLDRDSRVAAVYTGEVRQDDLRAVVAQLTGEA